jgi:hypothetical protein
MCSAKLERWAECGLGLVLILTDGGGDRPSEETELLRDCGWSGEGMCASFFLVGVSVWSAMAVEGAMVWGAGCDGQQRVLLAELRAALMLMTVNLIAKVPSCSATSQSR